MSERFLALCLAAAIPVAAMQPANAASVEAQTAPHTQAASSVSPSAPSKDIHDQLDSELKYLSDLPELELDKELQPLERNDGTAFRVAPLVIVGAIGCAVGIAGPIFTKSWEDSNSAVWALAGALTSCIPGARQAKLVKVILDNKQMIAAALKKVGAFSLAAAILGANIVPVASAPNE